MTRRIWLSAPLLFAACRSRQPFPPDLLSESMPGGWRRTSAGEFTGARDPVPANAIEQSRSAAYQGPGTLEVHVYQLTSAAVGLDLAQRWRPSADTVFFNQGVYFVVIKWQSAGRKELQQFVSALESKLIAQK
jgi:hypothetical protein